MPSKIFISYRREDSAANALGIGQYLEHQFGRKNVFIDVDMRAGTKFPIVLEQRLAECKVMLVLIGPEWLNARDKQGNRRLDISDDWVRLEIAHALKRNIIVVPVCVNGGELPPKEALPNDLRGLLDHQAVSVTTAGFRHDMSGLSKDIRAISSSPSRRSAGILAAVTLLVLVAVIGLYQARMLPIFMTPRPSASVGQSEPTSKGNLRGWVLYAVDKQPKAYYFESGSVKNFGDRVSYLSRFPFTVNSDSTNDSAFPQSVLEEDQLVLDCKQSIFGFAEKTFYGKSEEALSHLRLGDPDSVSLPTKIEDGSVISLSQKIFCDKKLTTPILPEKISDLRLAYLSPTVNGDGDIYYGTPQALSDRDYQFETLVIVKNHTDRDLSQLFPGQNIVGLTGQFRTLAEEMWINCNQKKAWTAKYENYAADGSRIYLQVPVPNQPLTIGAGSPFDFLENIVCKPQTSGVAGTYEGTNNIVYKTPGAGDGDQKIIITVEQSGDNLHVKFRTPLGGQGEGQGVLSGNRVDSVSLTSTAAVCPGSYQATFSFSGNAVSWSYTGQDCGGPMEGHGTAKRS